MESKDSIRSVVDAFRGSGLRWTPQRQAIVDALFRLSNHPTAEEIYAAVRRLHPGMSRATVYNTMETLATMGWLGTIHAADGTRRYDPDPAPHHHLRCRVCGAIFDVHQGLEIPAPRIPAGESLGFRIESVRIEYHGICSACDRARPRGPAQTTTKKKRMIHPSTKPTNRKP
jgi:Fe2+ or Zn2+ uptake regulation protein